MIWDCNNAWSLFNYGESYCCCNDIWCIMNGTVNDRYEVFVFTLFGKKE